ncbi:MAG: hypothetical protein L3J82_08710 [Planctomycetes bacterium]|nr:hypothetical protein [Planctomycetota bacterium]
MSNMDCTGCGKRAQCQRPCDEIRKQLPPFVFNPDRLRPQVEFTVKQMKRVYYERKAMFTMLDHRHKLKGRQRQVFRMYYNKAMSTREIGRKLGVNQRTAVEYLKRARSSLARIAATSEQKKD